MGVVLGIFESKTKFLAFENLEMHTWCVLNGFSVNGKIDFKVGNDV